MASTSASSALVATNLNSETVIKPKPSTNSEPVDIKPEYTNDVIENAIRLALRTNISLFTRRTSTGKVIDHHYLAVATFTSEALSIDQTLFYGKSWWPKLIGIVNKEIVSYHCPSDAVYPYANGGLQVILTTVLPNAFELRIEDALRVTVASFVCTTTVNGTTSSVIDYASIYRAVEAQLGLSAKFLSHSAKYRELRRAVVKEEVAKLEAAARKAN